jgi:hypothetical protein
MLLLSPEIVALALPFVIYLYTPEWSEFLQKPMKEGISFGLSASGINLAALAFCYKEGSDILNPSGAKAILLEWPDYFMLKTRVVTAMAWCTLGISLTIAGTWMVASDVNPHLGATTLVAGVLSSAVATGTIALARLRIRELLPEK